MMRFDRLLAVAAAAALAACQGGGESGNGASADAQAGGATGNTQAGEAGRSIADAAGQSADLSEFGQAVQAAGLTETLRGAGPYTVFAPVNAAFGAIPQETRTRLMATEGRERLTELLTAHIVPGVVTVEDLDAAMRRGQGRAALTTVSGGNLTVSREGDALIVSDSSGARGRIVRPDGIQSNGVIHQIDSVLMPGGR